LLARELFETTKGSLFLSVSSQLVSMPKESVVSFNSKFRPTQATDQVGNGVVGNRVGHAVGELGMLLDVGKLLDVGTLLGARERDGPVVDVGK